MTPSEFIENESFRRWVFSDTSAEAAYWERYLMQHPDDRESAHVARTFLLTAKGELPDVSDQQVGQAVGRILSAVPNQPRSLVRSLLGGWQPIRVAASVALLLVATGLVWRYVRPTQDTATVTQTPSAAAPAVSMTELTNRRAVPRLVRLADGSLVVLQQDARIRFPKQFGGPKRDVYLTGKAFFEVVRNPAKPFRVFAGELMTEVLGTSFLISAPETGGKVQVLVKTGKVSVSTNPAAGAPAFAEDRLDDGRRANQPNVDRLPAVRFRPATVTLLPNQQVTFSKDDARLVKRDISRSTATVLPATTQPFSFRRTPLPVVLDALAKAYGIVIQFDRDALAGCTLTARLDDPSLFTRLDVIATSTGSTYELQNGQLVIHSAGCR